MKIILTFFWIIIGAVLLWFFAENLDQSVTIDFFGRTYEHINLVTVIFVSTLLGLLLGTVIMTWQVIKHKARVSSAKRENKKLLKKIEELEKQVKEHEQAVKLRNLPDDPDSSNSGFNS
ncbi:LapA family protein [Caldithrix abyssi]